MDANGGNVPCRMQRMDLLTLGLGGDEVLPQEPNGIKLCSIYTNSTDRLLPRTAKKPITTWYM